jgi:FtsP/CotA-like multicopper oxidase with cupredoxin domain
VVTPAAAGDVAKSVSERQQDTGLNDPEAGRRPGVVSSSDPLLTLVPHARPEDSVSLLSPLLALVPSLVLGTTLAGTPAPSDTARVVPNDNRAAAGRLRGDTLDLRLVARVARWHPDGDDAPGAPMQAFAEEGGAARIPGPLVRVRAGTVVEVSLRNALADTMRVYGLHARPRGGKADATPLVVAPGEQRTLRFALDAPGTYLSWATTTGRPLGSAPAWTRSSRAR